MNIAPLGREATLEDLWEVEGRAELIDGEIVPVTPSGQLPVRAAARIWRSLDDHEPLHGGGLAVSEGANFVLRTPGLQALSPDAAWWPGDSVVPGPIHGPPRFAAEVRSLSDYGPAAERAMALKRARYFAGGTLVVWDVDVIREGVIRAYHADDPENPIVFRRGEIADAEPAVPGWRFPVDELFA
ncbi:MAG TPA: Uma2 family endonuclease [Longimicrobium sp.]|nr:Uma2 family endonuclease [Longimicrobium sp.]